MTTLTQSQFHPCHVCKAVAVEIVPGFEKFHRIASDCKPWPPSATLVGICGQCGCSQAVINSAWYEDIRRIYAGYDPYYQAAGVEQNVFDSASGAATTRSLQLVNRLHSLAPLAATGRLLDVGCGNGAMLRAFSGAFKSWTMAGLDVHEHLRPVIESIERVERLYTCPIEEVPGRFQLASLIHALEHIVSPRDFLVQLRDKLEPSGLLLVQVPDTEQNPFVLMVADHSSHFFLPALKRVVESAGYDVLVAANDWIAKELTIVARKKDGTFQPQPLAGAKTDLALLRRHQDWLNRLVEQARTISAKKPFGLFGSSIAGTWLFNELDGAVEFFVDEDPNRPGNTCFDRPIYAPPAIPKGAHVFIALPPTVANNISERMKSLALDARFYTPDPI